MGEIITTRDLDDDGKLRPDYIERRKRRNVVKKRRNRVRTGMKRKR